MNKIKIKLKRFLILKRQKFFQNKIIKLLINKKKALKKYINNKITNRSILHKIKSMNPKIKKINVMKKKRMIKKKKKMLNYQLVKILTKEIIFLYHQIQNLAGCL